MASITKRNNGYTVRWWNPGRVPMRIQAPDRATAEIIKAQIESTRQANGCWPPDELSEMPDLETICKAFLDESKRIHAPNTTRRLASCLDTFLAWMVETKGTRAQADPQILSKGLLVDLYEFLLKAGRHGRPRQLSTVRRIITTVEQMWEFADGEDRFEGFIPRPKKLAIRLDPRPPVVAPIWTEMDACIGECNGWHRQLAMLLRFTGLRVQQAMLLKWSDFDLEQSTLQIRGELGKSRQERQGRIMPVSRHLIAELAGWGQRSGWVVKCGRNANGPRAREARGRDMGRAWKRAGVREEVWKQRPHHAFRKGFNSELIRAGAHPMAIEYLLGHSLGMAGFYTDANALPLRAAVDLIPPLKQSGNVIAFPDIADGNV